LFAKSLDDRSATDLKLHCGHPAAPSTARGAYATTVCAMTGSAPRASVIVRTKDSARTLGGVLSLLRAQTVPAEIIVVDSGSSDRTLAIAREGADRVIELDPARFSFGRSLNHGAAAAGAPIHFALSSHAFPANECWIERSLSLYGRPDVAATNGAVSLPGSPEPPSGTFYQRFSDATAHPLWGFSNTGSSWRADVWAAFPFDEHLPTAEDKQWAFRVLAAGWKIAFDPRLSVSDSHRRRHGLRHLYRRTRREVEAVGSFANLAPMTPGDLLRTWLTEVPSRTPYRGWRRRLNYFRMTELLARYHAVNAGDSSLLRSPRRPLRGDPPTSAADGAAEST